MIRITLLLLLLAVSTQAQITLEKSYTGHWRMSLEKVENDGYKYVGADTGGNRIYIYNEDHSLWKTININLGAGTSFYTLPYYCSRTLFDSDNDIEVIVRYSNGSFAGSAIINEDGSILKSFSRSAWHEVKKSSNGWKLIIHNNSTSTNIQYTDIYSLPGQYSGLMKPGKEDPEATLYPNPVAHSAVLEYSLPNGSHTGTIGVYNTNGVLMRQYQVTNQFDNVIIERGALPAGMYTYQLQSQGQGVTTGKFTVQ